MKTITLLAGLALLPLGPAWGETIVHDPFVESQVSTTNDWLKVISPNIATLLDTANKQLTELQNSRINTDSIKTAINEATDNIKDLNKRMGDPSSVKPTAFNDLRDRVKDWINKGAFPDPPKYDKSINDPTSSSDGDQAFSKATIGGLFDAIGDTFKPDPTKSDTEPRDPKLYVGAVDELAAVKHYYEIREAAIDRRKQLQDLLYDALDEVRKAENFATLQKQTALVEAIEAQLKACNDDIATAFNDTAVRGIQVFAMSQIKTAADNEALGKQMSKQADSLTDMKDKTDPTKVGSSSSSTSSTSGYTSGFLPWHSK